MKKPKFICALVGFISLVVFIIWLLSSEVLRKTITEKSNYSSSGIVITVESTCHWSCAYDPYVTFINHNNREVTILVSSRMSENGNLYYTKINMFVLKPGQKITKYIGCDNFHQLNTLEAIITSTQGTAETIRLWQ
jgi:hypothetical protein